MDFIGNQQMDGNAGFEGGLKRGRQKRFVGDDNANDGGQLAASFW